MSGAFSGLALSVDTASRLHLVHPVTRQPLSNASTGEAAWIDLYSTSSAAGRAHDRAITDRAIKTKGKWITAEQLDSDGTDLLVALTKGWSLVDLSGQPIDVPCSPAAARELYTLPAISWVRAQATEFVAELGNFPGSFSAS